MVELMTGRSVAVESDGIVRPPCMAEVETARAAARARFAYLAEDGGDDEVSRVPEPMDPDNPPMTDSELARLRPAVEVAPALVAASLRRRSGRD